MTTKMRGIVGLFIVVCITLLFKSHFIKNMYNTILGRIALISIIIFFSLNNVTLGLLIALCLIIILNKFRNFSEGMSVMNEQEPKNVSTIINVNTGLKQPKLKINKDYINGVGVDVQSIEQSIASVDSNKLPISNNNSSENVSASSPGLLQPNTLTGNFTSSNENVA